MKKNLLAILLILSIGALGLYAESLEDVLKKNYESRGGLDKLKALKTSIIEGKALRMGVEFPIKMTIKRPNKMYMEAEFMGKRIVQAYNGKIAWWIMPLMGIEEPTEMSGDQANEFIQQAETMDPLVRYKELGHKLELIGKEDMEGTEVYKLKLTRKDTNKEFFFYLDVESGIELKSANYLKINEKEILMETYSSDYKEVDGMMVAHQIQTKQNGAEMMTMTMTSYTFNTEVDDSLFNLPPKKETPAQK